MLNPFPVFVTLMSSLFAGMSKSCTTLKKQVFDLIFAVTVDHRKARLLRHLVFQLIFGNINGHNLHGHIHTEDQNHRVDDGLDLASASLAAALMLSGIQSVSPHAPVSGRKILKYR